MESPRVQKPWQVTEHGQHLCSTKTYRSAQVATARRIASDVTGRVLTITGPEGRYEARSTARHTIDYRKVSD